MWPIVIGVGLASFLIKAFSNEKSLSEKNTKKKIFISFAYEDKIYRDHLISQRDNGRSPFTFMDMSVKKPWNEEVWKNKCRAKIKKCDGVIVLLSKHTWHSSGTRWEMKCAVEENIPIVGMHIKKNKKGANPPELKNAKIIEWNWKNINEIVNEF